MAEIMLPLESRVYARKSGGQTYQWFTFREAHPFEIREIDSRDVEGHVACPEELGKEAAGSRVPVVDGLMMTPTTFSDAEAMRLPNSRHRKRTLATVETMSTLRSTLLHGPSADCVSSPFPGTMMDMPLDRLVKSEIESVRARSHSLPMPVDIVDVRTHTKEQALAEMRKAVASSALIDGILHVARYDVAYAVDVPSRSAVPVIVDAMDRWSAMRGQRKRSGREYVSSDKIDAWSGWAGWRPDQATSDDGWRDLVVRTSDIELTLLMRLRTAYETLTAGPTRMFAGDPPSDASPHEGVDAALLTMRHATHVYRTTTTEQALPVLANALETLSSSIRNLPDHVFDWSRARLDAFCETLDAPVRRMRTLDVMFDASRAEDTARRLARPTADDMDAVASLGM